MTDKPLEKMTRAELEQLAQRWRSEAQAHTRAGDAEAAQAATERAQEVEAQLRALDDRQADWLRRGEAAAQRVEDARKGTDGDGA